MSDKEQKKQKPKLLPTVTDYLEILDHNLPISTQNIENIVQAVESKTGLTNFSSKEISRLFFQEIRNSLLRRNKIRIKKIGTFFISSPKTTFNKKRVFVKYVPSKTITKKLNGKI